MPCPPPEHCPESQGPTGAGAGAGVGAVAGAGAGAPGGP